MQEIENDMDDLFREAAQNYRLKDPGSDWDKIVAGLPSGTGLSMAPASTRFSKKVMWLVLLLLVMVAGGVWIMFNPGIADVAKPAEQVYPQQPSLENNQNGDSAKENLPKETEPSLHKTGDKNTSVAKESIEKPESVKGKASSKLNVSPRTSEVLFQQNRVKERKRVEPKSGRGNADSKLNTITATPNTTSLQDDRKADKSLGRGGSENLKKDTVIPPSLDATSLEGTRLLDENVAASKQLTNQNPKRDSLVAAGTMDTDSLAKANVDTLEESQLKAIKNINPKKDTAKKQHFYFGIVTGPEWNEVKRQGYSKTGFDVGIVGGYQFSRKFSVEIGVIAAQKLYYSDGKHFNLKMPGMEVVRLEGKTMIIEVPVNVKYNFIQKRKTTLFSTAGVISYFLTNETNDYVLLVNGAEQSMTSSYNNSSKYAAAALDLGIGYEYLQGKYAFRMKPYIQMPLKGIGVGSMRVMSTGIHIGVFRH